MQMPVLSVRRGVAALACSVALVAITACGNAAGVRSADSTPANSAEAGSAAELNGIDQLSAKEIYDRSRKANSEAGSFREKMTREDAKSELLISATECVGSVEMPMGSFEIIRKGEDVWAKPGSTLVKELGIPLSAGTWIHGAPNHPLMKGFVSWCHQEQITDPDTLKGGMKVTKGKVVTVDGRKVVPLILTGGESAKGESVTWYAAATGEPYYVGQVSSREDMPDVVFSDFGKPVGAQAPSGPIEEAPEE